jgi:chromosome segregation ATPase
MKRYFLFLFSILFILSACTNKKELEALKRQNDSLQNIVKQSDYTVQQYLSAFNEIQENLNKIKQAEHIINIQTAKTENGQLTQDQKQQINQDILTIYKLMEENKQKLAELKRRLYASRVKNKQLLKTIELYEQQLKEKDQEINELKDKLAKMNINIQQLNQEIASLKSNLDTMKQIQQQQEQKLMQQDIMLHTAYYVVGTKKELMKHGVLTRHGFLSKLEVTGDFDKSYFTKIDIRKVTKIPIMARRIEILTPHPQDSYQLEKSGHEITDLLITDPNKFWETSKFLVIMVK